MFVLVAEKVKGRCFWPLNQRYRFASSPVFLDCLNGRIEPEPKENRSRSEGDPEKPPNSGLLL